MTFGFGAPHTVIPNLDIILSAAWVQYLSDDVTPGTRCLSQIINGGRDLLYVAFVAAILSTTIAVAFGTLAGFVGGWVDTIIVAITDFFLTIPQLPLFAVLAAFIQLNSLTLLGLLIGGLSWPALLRAVRAQALPPKSVILWKQPVRSTWEPAHRLSRRWFPT